MSENIFEDPIDDIFKNSVKYVCTQDNLVLNNIDLLFVYGLFKQATEGDNNSSCPTNIIEKQNWSSWFSQRGKNKTLAKIEYIKFIEDKLVYQAMLTNNLTIW